MTVKEQLQYLAKLRETDTETLLKSMADPSKGMRDIHIRMHQVVLRSRGVLKQ